MLAAMMLSHHWVSSSRTFRPRSPCHTHCRLWGTLLRLGLRFVQWRCTGNPVKKREPIVHGQMESLNINLQASLLNPSCSGYAHSNRLGTGNGCKSMKPHSTLFSQYFVSSRIRVFSQYFVSSRIRPLGNNRLTRSIQLVNRPEMGQLYKMFWPSTLSPQVTLAA